VYNIFKRPMFKLGGQADQGSGIMSTVEPRQNYMFGNVVQPLTPFQNTYTELPAYAYGGRIGYANGPGPVLPGAKQSTIPTFGQKEAIESLYGKQNIENAYQKEVQRYMDNIRNLQARTGMLSQDPESGGFIPGVERDIGRAEIELAKLQSPEGKRAFETRKAQELNKIRTEAGLPSLVIKEEPKKTIGEGEVKTKKPTTTEATTTDPREDIRKEAAVLKDLLKDEGLTTAENAFIIAKALATPGGFNAKVAAAANLAMPIIKERSKLDRDVTLEAYKTSKEMEKARIAAGKKDPAAKFTEDYVENKIRVAQESKDGIIQGEDGITRYKVGNEYKTRAEIERDFLNVRGGIVPPAMRAELSQRISETERQLRILSNQKQSEEIKKQIEIKQEQIKKDKALLRGEFKTGGRVQKQFGGMMDTTEDATIKEAEETNTIIDTNVAGTPMKPVQKLTYEQIRDRLPQEITDDIVKLIANSAEALQDFAYIKTQQDVNQFNIKYGVNLVLPQGA
jgi:DNA-binding CsgD family transcriptional regulator